MLVALHAQQPLMSNPAHIPPTLAARAGEMLVRRSGLVVLLAVAVTLALVPPLLLLPPSEDASTEPGGEAFDLRDEVEAKLASPIFPTAYIAEARPSADGPGDMLTQAALWELFQNEQALREADADGALTPEGLPARPYLAEAFDQDAGATYAGVTTLADAVQLMLAVHPSLRTSLAEATDEQVKFAVAQLLANPRTASVAEQLSVKAAHERRVLLGQEVDAWSSPALVVIVRADNKALGGGSDFRALGGDVTALGKERFARNVQEALRGEERSYRLWGLAIDQNLEAEEEGRTAGLFVMLTVIAAIAVVGLSLRSYWAVALTATGLGVLMVWLKGISNLIGIKGGLIIELIVPIAMVSLGVDFAVHAVRRYREEGAVGVPPEQALRASIAGVLGALTLAMLSDGIAFLSNVPSGIEAVVHFGVAAGVAVASSLVVLGVVVPLLLMRIDRFLATARPLPGPLPGTNGPALAIAGGAGAAAVAGAGVILLVAVDAAAGVAVIGALALTFVGLPLLLLHVRAGPGRAPSVAIGHGPASAGGASRGLVPWFTVGLARRPAAVLAVAALVSAGSIVLATRLEAALDVKDFFDSGSDLVVGLDKLDEHVGARGGEGGILYVRGDLTDPGAVAALQALVGRLAENPYVGREADGSPSLFEPNVLSLLRLAVESALVRAQVEEASGLAITGADGDGVPDTRAQLRAVLDHISLNGVRLDAETFVYRPEEVGTALYHNPFSTDDDVATLWVGIPGTREQSVVRAAAVALQADLEPLLEHPAISRVGLTGSPFIRDAELSASTNVLRTSLPIAAVGALLLLLVAMRSVRYAVVTVVPIGLVVAWLYAIMQLSGFALNFITATIGAVSVGVGIDYSIHMTERFREELRRSATRLEALERASAGTGVALLGSAGSSIVGFGIMGFAPMPMFASYGTLTAIMIFLALTASLAVLPSLLMLVTPERERG